MIVHSSTLAASLAALALLTVACGSNDVGAQRTAHPRDASQGASQSLQPCKLLTDAQVRTVLPDLADSSDMSTGNALVKTIQSYQCSHVSTNAAGMLIVIINSATNAESFSSLKESNKPPDDAKKVDIADGGWVYPKDNGLEVLVLKGRAVIHLDLDAKDAAQKSQELVELARIVAAKVG
jgi:hypothetical protein